MLRFSGLIRIILGRNCLRIHYSAFDVATYDETRLLPKNSYVIDYYSPLSFDFSNICPNWCSLSANNFLSISFVW